MTPDEIDRLFVRIDTALKRNHPQLHKKLRRGAGLAKLLKLKNLVYLNYYCDPGTDAFTDALCKAVS